jgi:hypothetical protein
MEEKILEIYSKSHLTLYNSILKWPELFIFVEILKHIVAKIMDQEFSQ